MSKNFEKYSGCGNDFIIIDNRDRDISTPPRSVVSHLCHRRLGIGADGLILLENSENADFRMRIFNADGSEAEMCGNGIRCLARFIHEHTGREAFTIETMLQQVSVQLREDSVEVKMPLPTDFKSPITLEVHNQQLNLHHLDTGVPHAIIFVDEISDDRHLPLAPAIRFHPRFQPRGANVNFAQILTENSIAVRTYERGVEQETLACGTGAVAVALVAALTRQMESPIDIITRSKDILKISFNKKNSILSDISMAGPAIKTFQGTTP